MYFGMSREEFAEYEDLCKRSYFGSNNRALQGVRVYCGEYICPDHRRFFHTEEEVDKYLKYDRRVRDFPCVESFENEETEGIAIDERKVNDRFWENVCDLPWHPLCLQEFGALEPYWLCHDFPGVLTSDESAELRKLAEKREQATNLESKETRALMQKHLDGRPSGADGRTKADAVWYKGVPISVSGVEMMTESEVDRFWELSEYLLASVPVLKEYYGA